MSKKQTTITIESPDRLHKECFVSTGHVCGYCHGKGWFDSGLQKEGTVTCPDCGGTGELMAVVSIEWKPNDKQ